MICIDYNLDTDTLEQEGDNEGNIIKVEELSLVVDYNFDLSNIKTYKYKDGQKENVEEFSIGEHIVLEFNSTNETECVPKRAVINGKEYEVSGENDTYEVLVDGFDAVGEQTIRIEKIILSNGKTFEINEELSVEIIKNAPTAVKFSANENVEEKYIKIDLYLKDDDKTITDLEAKVFDEQDNEISSQNLKGSLLDENITNGTDEDLKNTYYISANLNTSETTRSDIYIIKIFASYNLVENNENYAHINKVILEEELEATPVVDIKNVEVSNKYPEKGENVTLTYKIETNKKQAEITHIKVNNLRCKATKHIDDEENVTYSVTYNVGESAGILNLNTTEFEFEKDLSCKVNNSVKVDVLKTKITSEAFTQVDDVDNRAVTLTSNIIDSDNSLIELKVDLVRNSDNQIVKTKTFSAEEVTTNSGKVTFRIDELELETEYTLVAKVTYDRDTNTIEEQTNKNYVEDEELRRRPIQLIADYEIKINNIKTYNGEKETRYFERGEEVTVKFSSTNKTTDFYPVKAVINDKEYELEKQGEEYKAKIPVVSTYGPKTIKIEKIILNNTVEIEITENNETSVGILKLRPTVEDFAYTEDESGNNINVEFTVNDPEETITGGKILVLNDSGKQVKEENFNRNSNGITFPKGTSEGYVIKVLADYDLDTNEVTEGDNEYTEQELISEEINVDRLIEFKDISSIELYKQNGNNVEKIKNVAISDLNDLTKFAIKVNMENDRSFYTSIRESKIQDNNLKFVLDYDQIIQYEGEEKRNQLEVEYGYIEEGIADQNDLENLISKIKANPSGSFNLYKDYDASEINKDTVLIDLGDIAFTGTINGNGHKIYNLNKPLFKSLEGATITNLILEDVTLAAATSNGTVANTATNANIKNVHIKNLNLTSKANATAGFIGTVTGGIIEECSLTKFNVSTSGHIRIAGIAGYMAGGTIKNCYVEGTVNSKQSKDGNGIGSIIGHGTGATPITIENCISKVEYIWTGGGVRYNGGIIGLSQSSNAVLKNNISLSTGTGLYKVHGSNIARTSTNNYELEESTSTSNSSGEIVKTVSKSNITSGFFKDTANFDENIWNLSETSYDKLPTLKNDDPNNKEEEEQASIYIPDYTRIKKLESYQKDKENLYYNMYRLMPFYDAKYCVKDGNLFEKEHILNTKVIKNVLPFDENGKLVLALSEEQKDKIKTIKILFTDNETVSYQVSYKKVQGNIVHYKIEELGIDYTFDKYLVNTQSNSYQYIVNQVKAFDFTENLAILAEGNEVRTTTENYEVVKADAENFAMKLLANNEIYSITTANSVVDNKIKNELTTDKMLEKLAYVYNYYNRYYNIEIGGINMSDIVFFDSIMFNDNLNSINMTNAFINANATDRSTNRIVNYYNTYIKPNTGLGYMDFLEYFIKNLTEDKYKEDPASWIIDNFNGIIYEQSAPRYPNIRYRVWDHLKALNSNMIPLLLSYQGEEMYLLGVPTTILTGNIELYGNRTKEDRVQLLKNFASYAVPFYDTIAGVVEGTRGYTNMLNMTKISYDSTYVKNWSQDENIAPAFKAFNEPLNLWITAPASAAAVANGSDMIWLHSHCLTSFVIYSHEAVHNQDGSIFLEGTGRRRGAGGEHFTDNFLTQGNNAYGVVPNYSLTRSITTQTTTNISKDRVDTKPKIESYYKGMYDTFAYLDYIEAQAFLQLTPAEQCRIAQVVEGTAYVWKTEEDFKNMNLKTIEDIWDNHLVIIRGNKAYTTGSFWYIYENKAVGAAPKAFFVLNAYQFLADFGYAGYTAYAGNAYGTKTDEEILRIIAEDDTMTFKKYQLSRYDKVKEKLNQVEGIDAEEAIKITLEAMRLDVEYNKPIDINSYASIYRETLYHYLKRVTNDFETSIYDTAPNVVHIRSAEELIEKVKANSEVNIVLDADIDFSGYEVGIDVDYYINTFVGDFDGNGHTIRGLARPLFSSMLFAKVKNLTIADSEITSLDAKAGSLAKAMSFSILENININNVTVTGTATVGSLVGTINKTTVTDITYNSVNVSSNDNAYNEVGGLFGVATYSYIENVHGSNSNISGKNNVGGIAGNVSYMHIISESSFNGTITSTGNNVGGLVGALQNSKIENSYSLGKVTGNSFVGGLAGNVTSSIIDKTYSNATVKGKILAGTGGLVGSVANASNGRTTSSVKNSIALGRVNNGYKFDAYSAKAIIENGYSNNYELVEAMGRSTLDREGIEFNDRITSINISDLNNEFYTNTLNWDNDIWNFENVSTGGLPKLKGLDTNSVNEIIVKTKISSIQDFLKINEQPEEIYILTQDLDFVGYTPESQSIITTTFTGKLEGNGHIISNLTGAALFAQFNGTVQDLNISNFDNQKTVDYIAAFAQKSANGTFRNMKFENVTLKGASNVGTVVGMDNRDSIFDRISVKNTNITATGMFVGGLVGAQYGGRVNNVYVDGQISLTHIGAGGIIGATGNGTNVTISNAISKVAINRTGNTDNRNRTDNAGLVGYLADTTKLGSISNSIALGNMEGYIEIMVPNKFIHTTEEIINSKLTKCYEVSETTGVGNATETTSGHLDVISRQNLNATFYRNLGFEESIWDFSKINEQNCPELK